MTTEVMGSEAEAGEEGASGEEDSEQQRVMALVLTNEADYFDGRASSTNLIESIVEEITLEGLDGITFQALKVRLLQRQTFEIEDFENIAPGIWGQLKYCKGLRFYLLPKPRADLVQYRWDESRDNRGHVVEQLHSPDEIYKYYPVEDKHRGIRGSCEYYHTRKDISQVCRKSSYAQVLNGLGNRLVIVASQFLRENALLGSNYKKHQNLSIVQYCIMERIGRSRNYGEVTRGKISLSCLNIQPKTLFYQRKYLLKSGLITRQASSIKIGNSSCPSTITVFHLPRFYKRMESAVRLNTRTIFSWLNNSPTKSIPIEKITAKFGKRVLKDFTTQFPTIVKTEWEQSVINPVESSGLEEDKDGLIVRAKNVRVLRLLVADISVQNRTISKIFDDQTHSAGDDNSTKTTGNGGKGEYQGNEEEKEQVVNISSAASYSDILALRPNQQLVTSTNCLLLCRLIMRAGISGLTILDIGNIMNLTPLESRACTRFLTRHEICRESSVKLYKIKAFTYTLTNVALQDNEIRLFLQDKYKAAMKQIQRIQQSEREAKVGRHQPKNISKSKRNKSSQKPNVNDENTAEHDDDESTTSLQVYSPRQSFQEPLSGTTQIFPLTDLQNESNQQEVIRNELEIVAGKEETETQNNDRFKKKTNLDDREFLSHCFPKVHLVAVINSSSSSSDGEKSGNIRRVQNKPEENARPEITSSEPGSSGKAILPEHPESSAHSNNNSVNNLSSGESMLSVGDADDHNNEKAEYEGASIISTKVHKKGIRSREDYMDKSIRQKLTRQRVHWTPLEDHILFVAYIASCMFIPKYTLDRIFMYNSTEIRDIMLIKADGRSDKTSAAIRRRLQFLVRQKSYFDWYVNHVSQAVRDDELYENHVKDYVPAPHYKIYISPPFEVLESVVDYLLLKFETTAATVIVNKQSCTLTGGGDDVLTPLPTSTRVGLTGIDTLLFLRQLKRAEFYWNGLLFIIFCSMGNDNPQAKREFVSKWQTFVRKKQITENIDQTDDLSGGIPVFELEEVKKIQMQMNNGESSHQSTSSRQEHFLNFCWKFLKFLTKHCNIMFNNILTFNSLSAHKFQIVSIANRNIDKGTLNICLSQRECTSRLEVRLWTAKTSLLSQIFSGEEQILKENLSKSKKKDKLVLEKATRSLYRARVLISRKVTNALKFNRAHLKPFMEGLPAYSFGEVWQLLRHLKGEFCKVDALACLSPGMLTGMVELTDYWTARISLTQSVFTVKDEWTPFSPCSLLANENVMPLASSSQASPVELDSSEKKRKFNSTLSSSKGKKRKRKSKRSTKKSKRRKKEDKTVNEVAEFFEDLSVSDEQQQPPPILQGKKVGLEEGENYLCNSLNLDTLNMLRIKLHPSFVGKHFARNLSQVMDTNDVTINFPNLEFTFSKKTSALNHSIFGSSHPFALDDLKELRQGLLELVYHHVESSSAETGSNNPSADTPGPSTSFTKRGGKIPGFSKVLNKYSVLFDLISIAGVVGVSGAFLETEFERKSLVKALRYLLDARLIFGVGVVHRRFVSFNNIKDWIIPIRPQVGYQIVVGHVILRPWITSVGGISWTTVSRLFTALIGQMHKPSIRLNELCEIFAPILSPVEALVLIESLARLKYLILYKIQEPKVTLFSKHPIDKCDIEYDADTLIDTKNVFVAISPYIATLHAQLQHAIQKTLKKKLIN